jgi:plastocyanin
MRRLSKRTARTLGVAVALAVIGGCGDDGTGLVQSPLVLAKSPSKSGDQQSGLVGAALGAPLRVVVTRDGEPVSDVAVNWATGDGSITPSSGRTSVDGLATAAWTLGDIVGAQTAAASVNGATGSPVTFTATGTEDTGGGVVVQVLGSGSSPNQFSPASISVEPGTSVTWQWADDAVSHNVVPDDGNTPERSGDPINGPHTYSYTFNTPGTYHYHCQTHGGTGGAGMSGTVTVTTGQF